jgi:hypothetical protein
LSLYRSVSLFGWFSRSLSTTLVEVEGWHW